MVGCPGRTVPGVSDPDWNRDVDADLDALREFGTSVLVTLMESHELPRYTIAAEDLAREVRARGMEWLHLPIIDMAAPDERFERLWDEGAGAALREHLHQGRTVVIHCLAGLGRTGTIAARLLVELGTHPNDAIGDVRAARRHTIQTPEQEWYVRACKAPREPPTA